MSMDLMVMGDSMVIQCLWCFGGRAGFGGSVRLSGVDVSLD